jgi:nitrogen fixation protein FixH
MIKPENRELTGRKVAMMFCAAFATIICANLALVYSAVGSFPGLETRAPYVESQSFEKRRIAQERLNWTSTVSYAEGEVILSLTEANGASVVIPNISMIVRRATTNEQDQELMLNFDGHDYVGMVDLDAGNWQAKIAATALDGTEFNRTLSLYIRPVQ